MRRIFTLIVIVFICCQSIISAEDSNHSYLSVKYFTDADGFPMSPINDMIQDEKGNLWMATHDGFVSYNGQTFFWYEQNNHEHVRINKLYEDHLRRIWGIDHEGGLYLVNRQNRDYSCILPDQYKVESVCQTTDGSLWINSKNTCLIKIDMNCDGTVDKKRIFHIGDDLVRKLQSDVHGNLWVLTRKGIYLLKPRNTRWHRFISRNKNAENEFVAITTLADKVLFGASDGGIYRYEYGSGKLYYQGSHAASEVIALLKLDDGRYAAVSKYNGLCIYSQSNRLIEKGLLASDKDKGRSANKAAIDSRNRIWVSYRKDKHISCFDAKTHHCNTILLGKDEEYKQWKVRKFIEDKSHHVWIFCDNYLIYRYNESTRNAEAQFPDKMKEVRIGFADAQGNIWIGQNGNLIRISPTDNFSLVDKTQPQKVILLEQGDGYIFAAYNDNTFKLYDSQKRVLGYLNKNGRLQSGKCLFGNASGVYYSQRSNTLWIADRYNGLYRYNGDVGKAVSVNSYHKGNGKKMESCTDFLTTVVETQRGHIWLGSIEYGPQRIVQTEKSIKFENIFNELGDYPRNNCMKVTCMKVDSHGALWIGTTTGLVYCQNPDAEGKDLHFRLFMHDNRNDSSLSGDNITSIIENHRGEIFISSSNGINKVISTHDGIFWHYKKDNVRYSNYIMVMGLDKQQHIWGAYFSYLFSLDTRSGKWTDFNSWDLPLSAQITSASCLTEGNGKLLLGSTQGILEFQPQQTTPRPYTPVIQFEELYVNGEIVTTSTNSLLTTTLDDCLQLVLPKDKNSFRIVFTAVDMKSASTMRYRARLRGLEKKWNELGLVNQINYSNIPKGEYVFEVQSTNLSGAPIGNKRELSIIVLPSFFESLLGIVVFVIIGIIVFGVVFYLALRFIRLKDAVAYEKQIAEIKTSNFTDIVHELRTPLTLVKGSLDIVMERNHLEDVDKRRLEMVSRNTNYLAELASQLLDWQKISEQHMKLFVTEFDIQAVIKSVAHRFDDIAISHSFNYQIKTPDKSMFIWADIKKTESVLVNIISNAFKYTPNGKSILINLSEDESDVIICVEDKGVGIPASKLAKLFDRFENNLSANMFSSHSTGLGLSLAKKLVEMHQGTIQIDTSIHVGTTIQIHLKKGREHYPADTEFVYQETDVNKAKVQETELNRETEWDYTQTYGDHNSLHTLLIVDDNCEICSFVVDIFTTKYHVVCAENGQKALEKVKLYHPDIIITDIMMPVMDGVELLKQMRADIQTSHIPMIMLTTKVSIEDQIRGFALGIDDYITKPFSATLLRSHIDAILERRKKLQATFLSQYTMNSLSETSSAVKKDDNASELSLMSPKEYDFLNKLSTLVTQKLSDSQLSVEYLSREVGLSRSVLTNKMKMLLGITPGEFIKDLRLKKSAELMLNTDLGISEIAYSTGFSDPHYFSKCFKTAYHLAPTDYREIKGRGSISSYS